MSISLGLWYMRGEEAARENVACKPQKISSSPAPRVLKCRRDHLSRTQANRFHPKNISYFFSKEVCDLRKNFTWRWNHQGVWTTKKGRLTSYLMRGYLLPSYLRTSYLIYILPDGQVTLWYPTFYYKWPFFLTYLMTNYPLTSYLFYSLPYDFLPFA